MGLNLKSLIGKLNHESRSALEAAAGLCVSRTHYDIEIEHYLSKLLGFDRWRHRPHPRRYGVDSSRRWPTDAQPRPLEIGNHPHPGPHSERSGDAHRLDHRLHRLRCGQVRTGFALLALVSEASSSRLMRDVSREFQLIPAEALRKDFVAIVTESHEEHSPVPPQDPAAPATAPRPGGKTPHLDQYTVNPPTTLAAARSIRSSAVTQIRQVVDI